jgi:hypothetical protein
MPKKKLTQKLREEIKRNYSKIRKSDLSGEALTYLNRVRGAAKARKIKENKYLQVGSLKIPKDSPAYKEIEDYAQQKGTTPKGLLKRHREAFETYLDTFRSSDPTHTRKLELQLEASTRGKIYNNGKEVTLTQALQDISYFRKKAVEYGFYDFIELTLKMDRYGNKYFAVPTMRELLKLEEETKEGDDFESYLDMNYDFTMYQNVNDLKAALEKYESKEEKHRSKLTNPPKI